MTVLPSNDMPDEAAATRRLVVGGLALTQLVGWGTLYYPIAVLGRAMGADLGLPKEMIFAGIAIMLLSAGAIAPAVGRIVDRNGARAVMAIGSILAATGLAVLSQAPNGLVYVLGWVFVGFAMPTALGNAAWTAVTQVSGEDSRRAITTLTFISGLASTVFWPLTTYLEAAIGWRSTLLVFAACNLALALPLHLAVLPTRTEHHARRAAESVEVVSRGILPPEARRLGFALLAAALAMHGVVAWGLSLHLIGIFQQLGLTAAVAVGIASVNGILQIAPRGLDLALGGRMPPMMVGVLATGMAACAFIGLLVGGSGFWSVLIFMVAYSTAAGFMSIARAALPLWLFGREGYGAGLGRLMRVQNVVFAAAPIAFAAVLEDAGPWPALGIGTVFAVAAACAMLALWVLARRAIRSSPRPAK